MNILIALFWKGDKTERYCLKLFAVILEGNFKNFNCLDKESNMKAKTLNHLRFADHFTKVLQL